MLHKRFQIEEMISQDPTGAVFLAMDSETGNEVMLQRFFPFGAGESGLEGDELVAYGQAVQRMKELEHPRLRRIIDGGCDPVDGMPFLVTESQRNRNLTDYCANAALSVAQGHLFVESALALMMDLEKTFGQVADWLVLHADDVEVIGDAEQFRFGMDPMKWLGLRQGPGTVKELATLAEQAMGWSGKVFTGSQAGLFAGWLRAAKTRSLTPSQAWEVLQGGSLPQKTSAPTVAVMPSLNAPAALAEPVSLASAKGGGSTVWIVFASIAIVAGIAVAIVKLTAPPPPPAVTVAAGPSSNKSAEKREPNATPMIAGAAEESQRTPLQEDQLRAQIERRAEELQKQAAAATPAPKIQTTAKPVATAPKPPKKTEYQPGEIALLQQQMGEEVTIVAPVSAVKLSSTDKSLYIEFVGGADVKIVGRYLTRLAHADMTVEALSSLVGKRMRVRGIVEQEVTKRLILDIKARDQITEAPAP